MKCDCELANSVPFGEQTLIPRGHPWMAWAVIVVVTVWTIGQRQAVDPRARQAAANQLQTIAADWQARYLVGAVKMTPHQSEVLLATAKLDRGSITQRLRNIVLVGEVSGAKGAAEKLKSLEVSLSDKSTSQDDRNAAEVLGRLYGDVAEGKTTLPSIEEADREALVRTLGWSGRLALHAAGSPDESKREELLAEARRTVVQVVALVAMFGFLALAGLAALATIVLLLLIRPQSRALPPTTQHGGIYAETFAVWMLLYVALSRTAHWLPVERLQALLPGALMLLSLSALFWPVVRGVAWQTVRQDVGLHFGRKPLVELLLGPVAYLAAIPMAFVGLLIVVAIMSLTHRLPGETGEMAPDNMPYHPIVGWLLNVDWWEKLYVVFLASVLAPLMEETMFRGFLYRQLRDATSRLGYVGSVVASGLATSFVFAGIHPQGWIAIPALMSLALAFTLAREWRGTLLPAMMAHGINNALLTLIFISMASH
jgi:membrane protease YdiL (CAAX protease family)